ncbi:MAG: DUF2442 domain-containing protein [Desulfobaccales bacterium]|jgi:hypothetical protein
MNILPKTLLVLITEISFEGDVLQVFLSDGREMRVPLEWFPKLRDASPEARRHWRLIGKGIGVHWPEVDEDLSLEGLLH